MDLNANCKDLHGQLSLPNLKLSGVEQIESLDVDSSAPLPIREKGTGTCEWIAESNGSQQLILHCSAQDGFLSWISGGKGFSRPFTSAMTAEHLYNMYTDLLAHLSCANEDAEKCRLLTFVQSQVKRLDSLQADSCNMK